MSLFAANAMIANKCASIAKRWLRTGSGPIMRSLVKGSQGWFKDKGLISIWLLLMETWRIRWKWIRSTNSLWETKSFGKSDWIKRHWESWPCFGLSTSWWWTSWNFSSLNDSWDGPRTSESKTSCSSFSLHSFSLATSQSFHSPCSESLKAIAWAIEQIVILDSRIIS